MVVKLGEGGLESCPLSELPQGSPGSSGTLRGPAGKLQGTKAQRGDTGITQGVPVREGKAGAGFQPPDSLSHALLAWAEFPNLYPLGPSVQGFPLQRLG